MGLSTPPSHRASRPAHVRRSRLLPHVRVGTSGWIYRHWRGVFYPPQLAPDRWFEHYSRTFDTVEINSTFYRLPEADTFDAWREQAPPGFVYAVKASRFLTHMKKLKDPAEPLARLIERARRLGEHLGPVLYQLPPRWRADEKRLDAFCRALPAGIEHVIEFRDPSWLDERIFALLEEHDVNLCVHDLLPAHPRRITGRIVYVRLHGYGARYAGSYPRTQLRSWTAWLREAAAERPAYVYFDNDRDAHAVRNALTLRSLLADDPERAARERTTRR